MTTEEMIDTVRNEYIEQIYALKSEAERKTQELEVYKKALELACEEGTWRYNSMWHYNTEELMNGYLQKAREHGTTIQSNNSTQSCN